MNKLSSFILNKNRFHYGWIIVALAFLCYFFSSPGQTFFISIFIDTYIEEFGWNRATVSLLYSIATLVSGLLLFFVGKFADKYGHRKTIIVVTFLLILSCIWNSFISNLIMLFIAFFAGRILGQGSMVLLPSTLLPHWFIKKKALAFSIMSVGVIVASILAPPVNAYLISVFRWQTVWLLWGGFILIVLFPLLLLFLYNKPSDIGTEPYSNPKNKKAHKDSAINSWSLQQALRTKSFWGMIYCQSLKPMITTGVVFHFISIMKTKGIDVTTASFILSLNALAVLPTTLFAGYLLEKIKDHHAASIISFISFVALFVLLISNSMFMVILFATLQGIFMGLQSVNNGIVWPNYFGLNNLGSIRGISMATSVIAAAVGPLPFGIAFDMFGSYDLAIIFVMFFSAVGSIVALFSHKPNLSMFK